MRDRVEHRRLPRAVDGDRDDVRLLARLQAADAIAQAKRLGTAPRRQFQRLSRRQRAADLLDVTLCSSAAVRIASNISRSLLLAAPSVPEPRPQARRDIHCGTAATPLASFMLLSGLCASPTPRFLQNLHVGVVQPHRVRGKRSAVPHTEDCRDTAVGDRCCASLLTILISSFVSARWISNGTPYLLASARAA